MNPLNHGAEKFLGTQIQTAQTWGKKDVKITCDAVIIGAGPGGLTTASVLAEQGLDVVVLEGGTSGSTQTSNASRAGRCETSIKIRVRELCRATRSSLWRAGEAWVAELW